MRKFLLVCLLAYAATAAAQEKSGLPVADLIKSRSFVFVVSDVQKKPGFNGVYGYGSQPRYINPNPSAMTISQSERVTSLTPGASGSNVQVEYYRLSQLDGSYFTAYNIPQPRNSNSIDDKGEQIYLTQKGNGIIISESKNPKSVAELKNAGAYTLSANNYKIKSSKKSDGSLTLTYTLKGGDQKQTFYIDVDQLGNAVLIQEPTKEFTTYMYGKIQQIPEKSETN